MTVGQQLSCTSCWFAFLYRKIDLQLPSAAPLLSFVYLIQEPTLRYPAHRYSGGALLLAIHI